MHRPNIFSDSWRINRGAYRQEKRWDHTPRDQKVSSSSKTAREERNIVPLVVVSNLGADREFPTIPVRFEARTLVIGWRRIPSLSLCTRNIPAATQVHLPSCPPQTKNRTGCYGGGEVLIVIHGECTPYRSAEGGAVPQYSPMCASANLLMSGAGPERRRRVR